MSGWNADKSELVARLRVLEKVLPRKGDMMASSVYNIEVADGEGWIWGGSLNERLMLGFEAGGGPWVGAIPAVEFSHAAYAAPGDRIRVWDDDQGRGFRISSGGAGWIIGRLAGTEFEGWESDAVDGPGMMLEADSYRAAIASCRYAVCADDTRPAFRQMRLRQTWVVAADGNRMHQAVRPDPGGGVEMSMLDIPERSIPLFVEILGLVDGYIRGWQSEDELVFHAPKIHYKVGRRAVEFPDVNQLIWSRVEQQTGGFEVPRDELLSALAVSEVTMDADRLVLRWIRQGTGVALVVCGVGARGAGEMVIEVGGVEDQGDLVGWEVHCSAADLRSLVEAVKPVGGWLRLSVSGSRDADPDDPGWVGVSMILSEGANQPPGVDGWWQEGAVRALLIV